MKRSLYAVSILAASLAIAAAIESCSSSTSSSAPVALPGSAPNVITITIPMNASSQGSAAFGTDPMVVQMNTTVTWINSDSIDHTSTSDSGAWDSGHITPGQSFSHQFTSAGSFSYHCSIHPNMTGTIEVVSASPSPSPSPSVMPSPVISPYPAM